MYQAIRKSATLLALLACAIPAFASNPRLATSPSGETICVQVDSGAVWSYHNSNPVTQAWSAGTTVSLPLAPGKIIQISDVAYAGDNRFVAGWVVYPNEVYTAYTDNGLTWSSPVKVGELGSGIWNMIRIAADDSGIVLIHFSGEALLSPALTTMRSVDRGVSFTSPQTELDPNNALIRATAVSLETNGSGSWYRAFTNKFTQSAYPFESYSVGVQTSLDGGLTWDAPAYVTGSFSNSRMLMGSTAFGNRASIASFYGDSMILGKLTFTNLDNNGASKVNTALPVGLPHFFGPTDYPNYLKVEAEMATDNAGNTVVVYKSRYTGANDTDLLSIRATSSSLTEWNTGLTYVSRQVDRNEVATALTCLGENKFLAAYDIVDTQNPTDRGIQTSISTDAGVTWTTGTSITGNVTPGDERIYIIPEEPQDPVKFLISSVIPKIKYKEPKPGKPPKPRKAQFKIVIGTTSELTSPDMAEIKMYLSDDDTLQIGQDTLLYTGTTKPIKPGKSGKANIKFKDFPDPAGKYAIIQAGDSDPYSLSLSN